MMYRREDHGNRIHLFISGELDALTAPELATAIDDIAQARASAVVVDLSGLELIDSSGVGVIVALFKRTRARGGRVRVRGARDQPLAVLRLLRMDRVFMQLQ